MVKPQRIHASSCGRILHRMTQAARARARPNERSSQQGVSLAQGEYALQARYR